MKCYAVEDQQKLLWLWLEMHNYSNPHIVHAIDREYIHICIHIYVLTKLNLLISCEFVQTDKSETVVSPSC